MKLFKTIISSLKHTKLFILLFFVLSIALNYLVTYIPVVIQYFIDVLLNQEVNNNTIEYFISLFNDKISFIPIMCILLFIIEGIIVLATYIRNITKNKIIQEFQFELKLKLFNHIQNLTYQDFYKNSLADLVQNSTDDVNNIVNCIEKQFTYILDLVLIIIFASVSSYIFEREKGSGIGLSVKKKEENEYSRFATDKEMKNAFGVKKIKKPGKMQLFK